MTWQQSAACRGGDATMFDVYPVGFETRTEARSRIGRAQLVCRVCPVAALCLADGLENHDDGVRGGVYLEVGAPRPLPGLGGHVAAPCGTHAAFRRHVRKGEPVDAECRDAERAYERARYSSRRRGAA